MSNPTLTRWYRILRCGLAVTALVCAASACATGPDTPPTAAALEPALLKAGANRPELERALRDAPPAHREGLAFLIQYMPTRDLQSLTADFLLGETALAYEAWREAPWREAVSRELFLNDVLPYALVSERREAWRKPLREITLPLIRECRSPGEAALRINAELFKKTGVKYSTQRARADQSPSESMQSGLASCTGLSILLVNACRAVGIPARLAGIPCWPDGRGNHTWVEVWDGNDWRFVGAAEPDPAGFDHAWFNADAARAQENNPRHAIFATSYRPTGTVFPLVWAPGTGDVPALNVTARYTRNAPAPQSDAMRAMIEVLDAAGKRVAVEVRATRDDDPAFLRSGLTRDESADRNAFLDLHLPKGRTYRLRAAKDGRTAEQVIKADAASRQVQLRLK